MSRRTARETAMKLLFEYEFNLDPQLDEELFGPLELSAADKTYLESVKSGVIQHLDVIDDALSRHAIGWELPRVAKVDKSILRLAVYEILFTDVPDSVAINEAVEMARIFSTDEAAPFINGILGSIAREKPAQAQ